MATTRNLGLDVGDRRIGVAISDPGGILARPLTIIDRTDDRAEIGAILAIIDQNQVGRVIIGLPLSMDGSVGSQAEKVRVFAQQLGSHTKVPIEFRDERLTTVAAQQVIKMGKKSRKTKDDAVAAALILQSYLEEKPA